MRTENKIKKIEDEVLRHKILYYQGNPEISDEDFDLLEDQLRSIDPQNPILQMVGAPIAQSINKVKHETKMLSLDKTYEVEEIKKWIGHEPTLSLLKIDGSSSSLIYANHHLRLAKTRGDGEFGEDITTKCFFIKDIPKYISRKEDIEIRGEVFCSEENFIKLSEQMKTKNLVAPSALRNIVAGILGRKEHIDLACFLEFKAFDIIIADKKIATESEKLKILHELGFSVPENELFLDNKKIEQYLDNCKKIINSADYLIDGVVFVYNNTQLHEEMGFTNHHPKFKKAFKFKGESKLTKIINISWGVSRNGVLTPVAEVEPINLSGAEVSRVTLHNFGLVKSFNLKADDLIEVIRSGEVIPKFIGVNKSSKNNFLYPTECPSCHGKLTVDEIWLKCINDNCPSRILEEMLYFIKVIGIEDISEKRLAEFISKKLISKISDLYYLTVQDFLTLDKTKEKLAQKMWDNIQKSKEPKLAQFIAALGIEGVSISKCEKIILNGYDTLNKILKLKTDDVQKIDSFAEKSASDFVAGIHEKTALIEDLIKAGFKIKEDSIVQNDILNKAKFCITGELSANRSEVENLIKANGGLVVSSVSKNTSFLITNELTGNSSKFLKAQELNIPIITEAEFYKKIGK